MSWIDFALCVCLYIRELVLQFLRYRSKILYAFFITVICRNSLYRTTIAYNCYLNYPIKTKSFYGKLFYFKVIFSKLDKDYYPSQQYCLWTNSWDRTTMYICYSCHTKCYTDIFIITVICSLHMLYINLFGKLDRYSFAWLWDYN